MKKLLLILLCVPLIYSCGDKKNNCLQENFSCEDQIKIRIYETSDHKRSRKGKPPLERDKITIKNIGCNCYENPYYGEINRVNETKYTIYCNARLKVDEYEGNLVKYYSVKYKFNDNCEPMYGNSGWEIREQHLYGDDW